MAKCQKNIQEMYLKLNPEMSQKDEKIYKLQRENDDLLKCNK